MNRKQLMVEALQRGETITGYREGGNSMTPIIKSRQPVNIHPLPDGHPIVGDVVFCKVHGRYFMHLVKAIRRNQVLIGNNHGHNNGWTTLDKVYGIVTVQGDDEGGSGVREPRRPRTPRPGLQVSRSTSG